MAKNPAPTLNLLIESSAYQLFLVRTLHMVTLGACWLNNLPLLMQIALSAMVLGSGFYQSRKPQTAFYLRYTDQSQWSIALNNHHYQPITIQTTTVISPWLVILHFQIAQQSFTRLIFSDSLPANDYRRLIVALKINP